MSGIKDSALWFLLLSAGGWGASSAGLLRPDTSLEECLLDLYCCIRQMAAYYRDVESLQARKIEIPLSPSVNWIMALGSRYEPVATQDELFESRTLTNPSWFP
ncbi:hypothetical protein F5X98DRAFT_372406 [Xylaria grammica]|nr:hypothetical protein F5X98DRAFT_372406 [Xylaria grammica]